MSRHEGVSCDSCLKGNFRGKRYKCLVCYDYDLCATCYEAGATTTRHTTDHPVQCILTRTDFDLYYGGEALTAEQPQSFTCPYCGKMGFTEASLPEHVCSEHTDVSTEVVCPVCAALPGGDPNHVTDDFAAHLTLEHNRTSREFEEPSGIRHVRRIPHPARGVGGTRSRRANMHIPPGGSTLSGLSPNGRETMDPIAELLSQLSSVRSRAAAAQNVSTQLQQLEMQLQSTRHTPSGHQQVKHLLGLPPTSSGPLTVKEYIKWQQLERLPRRQAEIPKPPAVTTTTTPNSSTEAPASNSNSATSNSQFLLSRCIDPALTEKESIEQADHSMFIQEFLLSTIAEQLQVDAELDFSFLTLEKNLQPEAGPPPEKSTSIQQKSTTRSKGVRQRPATATENLNHLQQQKSSSVGTQSVPMKQVSGQQASPSQISRATSGTSNSGQSSPSLSSSQVNVVLSGQGGGNVGQGLSTAGLGSNSTLPQAQSRAGIREARLNTSSAKRNMLKHLEATKASDREPPPH